MLNGPIESLLSYLWDSSWSSDSRSLVRIFRIEDACGGFVEIDFYIRSIDFFPGLPLDDVESSALAFTASWTSPPLIQL